MEKKKIQDSCLKQWRFKMSPRGPYNVWKSFFKLEFYLSQDGEALDSEMCK